MLGNGFSLYKTFVAGGITLTISLMGFMGKGIVDNERRNVDDHKEIRRETTLKIDRVKDIVTDIRIEQTEQRVLLQGIASKL